ncbi:MAG: hypothetical protein QNJ44_08185 [Rhodobacter sp.]|nr:hypothetical protein [Rhodobacter sp.]
MKRRDFVVSAGATAGAMAVFPAASPAHTHLSAVELKRLGIAIQGGFGAGFTLRSAERAKGRITALIEHNENCLEVTSSDLIDWTVLRATDM